jgi:hypothetical protein
MEYLGKLLRIDVDQGNPYAIPTTNPFYGIPNTLGEIWALGLRNPWRFSFDRLTGDLWIADVGQNAIEEINFQPAGDSGGENFGWRCYEGNQLYNNVGCISSSLMTFPIFTYPHGPECSVIGGYVYRGDVSSPFYGHYFFADFCSDSIWTLHNVSGNWVVQLFGHFGGNNFSSFGEDKKGQIYAAGLTTGTIYRVVDITSGINVPSAPTDIKIVQNPFTDRIIIETKTATDPILSITLCDVNGSQIYHTDTRVSHFEIEAGFLSRGIYFLKLSNNGVATVHKLIKL